MSDPGDITQFAFGTGTLITFFTVPRFAFLARGIIREVFQIVIVEAEFALSERHFERGFQFIDNWWKGFR